MFGRSKTDKAVAAAAATRAANAHRVAGSGTSLNDPNASAASFLCQLDPLHMLNTSSVGALLTRRAT